jgi:glycine/D-amino acid oxidase-like deaminating enzyme
VELRTGEPYWAVKNGLLHAYPPVRSDQSAEVVVLGAGVTGALIARALAIAGADVLVVDRHDVGMGSSAAATGLLQYATDSSLNYLIGQLGEDAAVSIYRFGLEAVTTIEALCLELGDPCGFQRRPSLYLASHESSSALLLREYLTQVQHGFDVSWLNRKAIEGFYGFSAAAALYCEGDGELDCYRFVHALMADAARRGVRVFDRTEIVRITAGTGGVVLETDRGHRLTAGRFISAAGYQTEDELLRTSATLSSTWAIASEPVDSFEGWEDRCLIWETERPYFYIRTTEDGRVLAGGRDERSPTRHESRRRLQEQADALAGRARRMFPALDLEVAYRWGGVFATTPDALPIVGTRPEFPNTWFALGYGGNGITFSVMAAAIIRDAYRGVTHPAAELFSFARPSLKNGAKGVKGAVSSRGESFRNRA